MDDHAEDEGDHVAEFARKAVGGALPAPAPIRNVPTVITQRDRDLGTTSSRDESKKGPSPAPPQRDREQ
jgi:hypothetical protein